MYRFIVLYVCIYVAPWSCEARHFVPLYVPTCSGMTIKLNLNLNLNLTVCPGRTAVVQQLWGRDVTSPFPPSGNEGYTCNRDVPYQSVTFDVMSV